MTKCSCLALKLASCSGIYRSSIRKRGIRGTDDGIAEIDDRFNFLRERERERERGRERERDGLCGGQKSGKIKSFLW